MHRDVHCKATQFDGFPVFALHQLVVVKAVGWLYGLQLGVSAFDDSPDSTPPVKDILTLPFSFGLPINSGQSLPQATLFNDIAMALFVLDVFCLPGSSVSSREPDHVVGIILARWLPRRSRVQSSLLHTQQKEHYPLFQDIRSRSGITLFHGFGYGVRERNRSSL